MAENQLQNGQQRMELVNLTVDDPSPTRRQLAALCAFLWVPSHRVERSSSMPSRAKRRKRWHLRRMAREAPPPRVPERGAVYLIHRTKALEAELRGLSRYVTGR